MNEISFGKSGRLGANVAGRIRTRSKSALIKKAAKRHVDNMDWKAQKRQMESSARLRKTRNNDCGNHFDYNA